MAFCVRAASLLPYASRLTCSILSSRPFLLAASLPPTDQPPGGHHSKRVSCRALSTATQDVKQPQQHGSKQVMAAVHLTAVLAGLPSIERVLCLLGTLPGGLTQNSARQVLTRLVQLSAAVTPADLALMVADPRFAHLARFLHADATSLSVPVLLDTLACLLRVGQESFLLSSMEVQLTWAMRKMSVAQLVKVIQLYQGHQNEDARKQRYEEALRQLERRWLEVDNVKHVVSVLYAAGGGPTRARLHAALEERALSLCAHASPKDLYRLLYLLARHRRRNTPLIRALTQRLGGGALSLAPVQLANLLYSCAVLSVYDVPLLTAVTDAIVAAARAGLADDAAVVAGVLRSAGALRWRHPHLMDVLASLAAPPLFAAVIATCAAVAYVPASLRRRLPAAMTTLRDADDTAPHVWLDAVWCCALVAACNNAMAKSVLCSDFQQELIDEGVFDTLSVQLRLIDIEATARLDLDNYQGPWLDMVMLRVHEDCPRPHRDMLEAVVGAIVNMAPAEKYLRLEVPTPMGHLIDIELILNEKGEPQPVVQYEGLFEGHSEGTTPLPKNFHRIALKLLDFSDMTLYDVQPSGRHAMEIRHLTKIGFTVVQIPYHEFGQHKKVVQRVQYLERKLKEATTPGGATDQSL